MINFVDAGGRANDSSSSAQTHNLDLIHTLIANTNVASPGGIDYWAAGPRIYFPPGHFWFSGPIQFRKSVHLMGASAGTRNNYMTMFRFPQDTTALIADSHNTNGLATVSPSTTAAGTIIDGIAFLGSNSGSAPVDKHGLLIRCFVNLRNVQVNGFNGHGIYVYAQGGAGQASNCLIENCGAASNILSGLVLEASDANIISVVGGDFTNNGDWGILDLSQHGNAFSGVHFSQNGRSSTAYRTSASHPHLNGYSIVEYPSGSGQRWVPRAAHADSASTTQPGTNENVWTRFYGEFEMSAWTVPVWSSNIPIRVGGPFYTSSYLAESTWTGCYSESNQPPSQTGYRTVVLGGTMGSTIIAGSNVGSGEPGRIHSHGGELYTPTSFGAKSLYIGRRGSTKDTIGMKMGAASSAPIFQAQYNVVPGKDYQWHPGDIIWNQDRSPTKAGVTPPLGWRCVPGNGDPPGQFEEIPFPTSGAAYTAGKNIGISGSTISVVDSPDFSSNSGTTGIKRTGSAIPANCALYVENTRGNHSWGLTAEFRVAADNDRPSIAFSHHAGESWSIGMMEDDQFKIKRRHGFRYGGWGEDYLRMDPVSGNVTLKGSITAAGTLLTSDVRLKEEVETIEDALTKVCRMRGVTFKLKESGESSSGVIAQELEEIAPELVKGEDLKSVAYGNLAGYLIEAVKELRAENAALADRLAALGG